ncbi:MAG: glycosyltransferase family 4 protein [Candidatus Spechtbacteria bacterium]|nr:glycosyltransferase family 4 protein [Candidatus Spechtbacteria bacterium]
MPPSSSKLRIGVDARVLMNNRHGGVGEYTSCLLEEMVRMAPQHEFHLFLNSMRFSGEDFLETLPPNCIPHIFRVPNKAFSLLHKFFYRPRLDALIGGIDVWWSPHFLPAPVSCPKVLTIHDLSFLYYPEMFDLKRRLWHAMVNPKHEAQTARKIIAVSRSTADDISNKWEISSEKIEVIYSGVGENFSAVRNAQELESARKKYHLPQKFILFFGVIEPRKNLAGLVRAFDYMRSQHPQEKTALVIAGSKGWSSRSLFETIYISPYRNDIYCIGFVDDQDKAALYSMAEIFVYPSFFEGFGFPPLEAMACGTPVVASHVASLPEIVQEAGILVDPLRLEEVAFAMGELLRDDELRVSLREKGLAQAKKFRWEEAARRTLNVLEETV